LQAARTKAELYRGLLAEGRNPWDKAERGRMERAADHIPTLAEAARKVHAQKVEGGGDQQRQASDQLATGT
jgi:acyl-CoA reductase-like NAD-dependent aldehyde dehydrogenase